MSEDRDQDNVIEEDYYTFLNLPRNVIKSRLFFRLQFDPKCFFDQYFDQHQSDLMSMQKSQHLLIVQN